MNVKQLTPTTKTNSLSITNGMILHIIPEFGYSVSELLHNSGLNLSTCSGIVVSPAPIKLGNKTFNCRQLHLDAKNILMNKNEMQKSINVFQNIPNKTDTLLNNKFMIIDHSVISQATEYMTEKTNINSGSFFLLQQLKKEFTSLKNKLSNIEHNIVFLLKSKNIENSIVPILEHISTNQQQNIIDNLKAFDKYIFVNIASPKPIIFPIAYFDKNGKVNINKQNINSISNIYNNSKTIDEIPINDKVKSKLNDSVIQPTKTDLDLKNDKISKSVNSSQLSKVLKKYKIKDKTVADNIKNSIDSYLKNKPEEINKNNIENIILMAVHKTIFNTDEISPEYLNNPVKLFSKLEELNTYTKEISYPKTKQNLAIQPDVISLNKVTGTVRHEYEFGTDLIHENIKQSFMALEKRTDNPIKIKNIKHTYEDNNLDRYINYEITLQNQTGDNKTPYVVNMKIPSLVNDRYFKLRGKNYVLANQQFFKPLTKTEPNKCRFLSSYAMVTMSVANIKYNISELDKILNYMSLHYPKSIVKLNSENNKFIYATLKDKAGNEFEFNFYDEIAFTSKYEKLIKSEDSGKWQIVKDNKNYDLTIGKVEYLYTKLINIMKSYNPEEFLKKSSRSIPYIQVHVTGIQIPLIIYLWQQLGFLNALKKLNLEYEITDKQPKHAAIPLYLKNKTIYIYPTSEREKLIANGLLIIDKKIKFDEKDINNPEQIDDYIKTKCGTRAIYNLNLTTNNIIDPVTKELLEFHDKSTNLIDLVSNEMIHNLLNDQADDLTDLKIYRIRQSEIMFNLIYKELMMAHNRFSSTLKFKKDSKIYIQDDYVIQCLLGAHQHSKGDAILELCQTYSPIAELKTATKLVKTGPGGVPNARSFKKEHRNIHKSYYGNVGANSTSEYGSVGLVNHNTLNPILTNKYGSYGTKDISNADGWDIVTLDEALVPFINELQADRAVLAYTHRAQVAPIINGELPIVSTGAEFVVPQLTSNRFIHRGNQDGKIIESVKDKYIKVKYKNNLEEFIDITPRLASTKRGSYLRLSFKTLNDGDTFKKNESIAWTSAFDGDGYSAGRNSNMAVMNYLGYSFEDGYVVSNEFANKFETEMVEELNVIIPNDNKVIKFENTLTETNVGDVLLEFGFSGDLDDYIDSYNLLDEESEESDGAIYSHVNNNIQIKSPGGEISEIRIYINDRNKADPIILKAWKNISEDIKNRQKLYKLGKTTDRDKIKAVDNLDLTQLKIGKHKYRTVEFEGTRVVFYIKKTKSLGHGDKVCNRYGGKGIVTKVLDTNQIPTGEFSGKIDIFVSPISVLGRKNFAVIKELYIGKILVNIADIISKYAKSKAKKLSEIIKLILSVYDLLDPTKNKKYYNSIQNKLKEFKNNELMQILINKELKFNLIMEPFNNISMENISKAAKILDIPLDEHVYIPELKTWTKNKVPVGIQYIQAMEQLASDYESIRSTGKYKSLTGQPVKGRADMGGQSLGNLDIYDLLSYDAGPILKELMTLRSDDKKSKREMIVNIIDKGETSLPQISGDSTTQDLYRIHMIGMGLDP